MRKVAGARPIPAARISTGMPREHYIPDVLHAVEPAEDLPLVFDSPHSGTVMPEGVAHNASDWQLRINTDLFVDDLFDHVTDHGAGFLRAFFPRTFVDANRSEREIDPSLLVEPWPGPVVETRKTRVGLGVIRKYIAKGEPMHPEPLTVDEVTWRLETFHRPYHTTLAAMLDGARERHGAVWSVNCHSTKSVGAAMNRDEGQRRADVILGDLDGQSAEPAFVAATAEAFRDKGYGVAINDPFKGAEIIRRFGAPEAGRHAIQIEINRALYLDEDTYEPAPGFEALRRDLMEITGRIADFVRDRAADEG